MCGVESIEFTETQNQGDRKWQFRGWCKSGHGSGNTDYYTKQPDKYLNADFWLLLFFLVFFFTVTLVGLPFCFKKSCKWKKKIMGDDLCHFKQLKSLDIRYYQYTCHYIQFSKKSNSFRCTCTSPVWVMEHFAVSHHVVLCIYLS